MIVRAVRAAVLGSGLILGTATCSDSVEPDPIEHWAADLVSTRQVLFMTFQRRGSEVSGTGTLAGLTNPGSEALTLTGTRSADSLTITYRRQSADPFRFRGRYTGPGIVGVLDGAEFVELTVAFRSR